MRAGLGLKNVKYINMLRLLFYGCIKDLASVISPGGQMNWLCNGCCLHVLLPFQGSSSIGTNTFYRSAKRAEIANQSIYELTGKAVNKLIARLAKSVYVRLAHYDGLGLKMGVEPGALLKGSAVL